MTVSLDTTATIPTNASIEVTVYEDLDGSGSADNTETNDIPDGSTTTDYETLEAGGSEYWLDIDFSNGDDLPSIDSATLIVLEAPSSLSITDSDTEDELTLDWDTVSSADGYYVYRAKSSGSSKSDYTQVADVDSPPYTDTDLDDGETYYYRVSSYA